MTLKREEVASDMSWRKFSRVSFLLELLYEMILELDFPKFQRMALNRQGGGGTPATHCNSLQHTATH